MTVRRLVPVAAIAALAAALHALGLADLLSLDALSRHHGRLEALVAGRPAAMAAAYLALYAAAVALSLPGAAVLTLGGGLLFGPWLGAALAVAAATAGATILFAGARRLAGPDALDRLGPRAARLAAALRRDAAPLLLALRLAPVFPFVLVNIVPALAGVRAPVFVATTLLGIIPGTLAFALAGAGLGEVIDAGRVPDLGAILTPRIILALLGLALLSLLGIPLRAWLAGRAP